ncbi:hypothetical protein [Rubritalea tangerina]
MWIGNGERSSTAVSGWVQRLVLRPGALDGFQLDGRSYFDTDLYSQTL